MAATFNPEGQSKLSMHAEHFNSAPVQAELNLMNPKPEYNSFQAQQGVQPSSQRSERADSQTPPPSNVRKISRKGSHNKRSSLSQQRKELQSLQLSNRNYDKIMQRSFDRASQVTKAESPSGTFDLVKANEKLRNELD